MIGSPLESRVAFMLGPIPISEQVVVTWALMVLLALGSMLAASALRIKPSRWQAFLEIVLGAIEQEIKAAAHASAKPYMPLIGTLFVFILLANWSSLAPGVEPPTAHIETDAALGLIVFVAIIYFGIRARGPAGYLKSFIEPVWLMAPMNILETFTRTFSMIVRLFGNVMSGVFIIGIVLSLAGLLVPIPLMALELLTGAVQAYIFTVLAMAFIAGAVNEGHNPSGSKDNAHGTH